MDSEKYTQDKPSCQNACYRSLDYRSCDSNMSIHASENAPRPPPQTCSLGRGQMNSSQYMLTYSQGVPYSEPARNTYPQIIQGNCVPGDFQADGCGRGWRPLQKSADSLIRFEGKWNEDDTFEHPWTQEENCSQLPRRGPEDFEARYFLQKRFPDGRDFRNGFTSERPSDMERYGGGEHAVCRGQDTRLSHPPKQEKIYPGVFEPQIWPNLPNGQFETSVVTRMANDSHSNYQNSSGGDQGFYDTGNHLYSQEEDEHFSFPIVPENSAPGNFQAELGSETNPLEETKIEHSTSTQSDKMDIEAFFKQIRAAVSRSKNSLDVRKRSSSVKYCPFGCKKRLIGITLEMNKMLDLSRAAAAYSRERQMSLDLVATSKNSDKFHPVFEHLQDAPKIEKKTPEQFSQDIITIIHQVKEHFFPLPDNTLHERFSELQAETGLVMPRRSYSKIYRTIGVSLVGFPNETMGHEPEQSVVSVIEPSDLRHDIERRRRERFQNEGDGDGHDFYISGAAERQCLQNEGNRDGRVFYTNGAAERQCLQNEGNRDGRVFYTNGAAERQCLQNERDGDGHDFYVSGAAERDIESRPPSSNLEVLHRR